LSYEILIKDKVVIKQPSNGRDKSYIGTQKSKFNWLIEKSQIYGFYVLTTTFPWPNILKFLHNVINAH
jgi:hypothetical protein